MSRNSSEIYANWIALVERRESRRPCTTGLRVCCGFCWYCWRCIVADRMIDRLFTGVTAENKRIDTLRARGEIRDADGGSDCRSLFIIFGMPTQTTTVLGLAGAGLTVAMKDFIVAFFGWFVLMGRNGIHVGDWVEINGVAGEVLEIGLLKTILLETGNWTDARPSHGAAGFVCEQLCHRRTFL